MRRAPSHPEKFQNPRFYNFFQLPQTVLETKENRKLFTHRHSTVFEQ